jgi:hypothetical protein
MYNPDRKQMIWTVIDAVQHGRRPHETLQDDDAMLSYRVIEDGVVKEYVDEFDDVERCAPYFVWFIAGTGYENFSIPLSDLTDESLLKLYNLYK